MRITLSWLGKSLAAILLVAGLGQAARAQDKAPMAAAPAAPVMLTSGNCGQGGCCDAGCDSCKQGGLVGSIEWLILKPFESENRLTGFDYESGIRLSLGYEGAQGLGGRVRYFEFNETSSSPGDDNVTQRVDVTTRDFELTQRVQLGCGCGLLLGGGLRWIKFQELSLDEGYSSDFVGPVVSAELTRQVGDSLALFASARGAILFGDTKFNDADDPPSKDNTGSVLEFQLGGQYQRRAGNGLVFLRAVWESQFYNGMNNNDSESLTLHGFNLTVGLSR